MVVTSRAPNRDAYLRRPDEGRRLAAESAERLQALAGSLPRSPELVIALGDGLSAVALQRRALPVLRALQAVLDAGANPAPHWAPPVIATQARVAPADGVGQLLGAEPVLILLGERPLSSETEFAGPTKYRVPGHLRQCGSLERAKCPARVGANAPIVATRHGRAMGRDGAGESPGLLPLACERPVTELA